MKYVDAHVAKVHFSQLMERVTKGERITITRRGEPIMIWELAKKKPEMSAKKLLTNGSSSQEMSKK